ncbi:hypothetical protein [Bacillus velezensis]|uniref:hypothetical protein n=1 Tax=Bacillus velezensis TaxID=492670 RepID=UPI001F111F1D|nr:hypothetical protein [Bacillus velezensis]UMQ50711.1 hypothetical protein MKF36_02210 [Bacillus velezensis]
MQAVKQLSFNPEVSGCFLSVKLNSTFRVSAVREGFIVKAFFTGVLMCCTIKLQ